MGEVKNDIRLFNSPIEAGMRLLLIINQVSGSVDIDRLAIYDYLALNTKDFDGPDSLHPSLPGRSMGYVVRRELLADGISILISKGLIKVKPLKKGLYFSKSELTKPFLEYMKSEYRFDFEDRAEWVVKNFGDLTDIRLKKVIDSNVGQWNEEFTQEIERNGGE